ncbi:MAG: UDP-N-acetylmuramate--L-alanine ligase [Bacteroidales bacterium]
MDFKKYTYYYFLGIGGIGMSALARYFKHQQKNVAGYDRAESAITRELTREGIPITHTDSIDSLPPEILSNPEKVLVVYTPAIPPDSQLLNYFRSGQYVLAKRSKVLGHLFAQGKGIAIAGTHGKTTTSTMVAHLLKQSSADCSAFLGGISLNYASNLLLSNKSDIIVAEADEYDRSFLQLFPTFAVITSIDADHLDIYGTYGEIVAAFENFIRQIKPGGKLVFRRGIPAKVHCNPDIEVYSYSTEGEADFYPLHARTDGRFQLFDLKTPWRVVSQLVLPLPGRMNLENATAACAIAMMAGITDDELRNALATFAGVKRRFEYHIDHPNIKLIDDYAHHPEEIKACIQTARSVYPGYKITGIFQPHLYSRTRDLAADFAEALSLLDELFLLDIYPAREVPIEGVSSEIILKQVNLASKYLVNKNEITHILRSTPLQVVITMGAGDIDQLVEPIKHTLTELYIK